MKNYILITSYTGGNYTELKSQHLINFVKQLKKYIDNSFIIVIDSNYVNSIEKECDIYLHKKDNSNTPHGVGELSQIKFGIKILESLEADYFLKFNYDFWMDDIVYQKYLEWVKLIESHQIVCSEWRANENDYGLSHSMACAFGVYKLEAAKKLFNYSNVEYPIERQLYNRSKALFDNKDIYVYKNFLEAFGKENFDIFNDGGRVYNPERFGNTYE